MKKFKNPRNQGVSRFQSGEELVAWVFEKITQNIAVIDQDIMSYQKAEFVKLNIYEDAITNLKTAYMQEKLNVYKKTTISERLAYPAIESIQLDDNEPITVQWAPVKTHKDYIENLYQVSEKVKISTTDHYSSSKSENQIPNDMFFKKGIHTHETYH